MIHSNLMHNKPLYDITGQQGRGKESYLLSLRDYVDSTKLNEKLSDEDLVNQTSLEGVN